MTTMHPAMSDEQPPHPVSDPVPTLMESANITADKAALRLVFLSGSKANSEFVFNGHALPFGRSIEDGLRFDPNVDGKVSGRHGQFRRDDRGTTWLLEDHGSTNGTFVNGTRVTKPVPLKHGDSVILGDANDHGVIIRVALGDAPLPTTPRVHPTPQTMAEPVPSQPAAGATPGDDGGFFSGIKGAFSRYSERRQLNKELGRVRGELVSAKAAAGSALQTLGVSLAQPDVLGRKEFAGLPATVALNDAADEAAVFEADLAALAEERASTESAHAAALAEADAVLAEAEQAVASAETAKQSADEARAAADTALREALAPWNSAATSAKDAAAAFLTQLQGAPMEANASETAAALRSAAELLDVTPPQLNAVRDDAGRAAEEVTAAEDALTAAREQRKTKEDERTKLGQANQSALAALEGRRKEIAGKQSSLHGRLAMHHVALAETAVAELPADFRDDDAWRSATTAVANRTAKQQEQANLERRLAELG